jgi:hypothetical protein
MSQPAFSTNTPPLNAWGYPRTALPPLSVEDPNAKVFTQVDIKGYRPKDFYTHKLWVWLQVQAQGLADVNAVDKFVTQQLTHVQKTPYVDASKTTAELFGLKRLDTLGQRVDIERMVQNPQAYQQQIQTQSKAMKSAFQTWTKTPQSFASGAKQFVHASFTKPFTNLWAGQEVVSSALSAFASILFAVNVGKKTYAAHKSAYNEGQRGGELALTTTGEFAKETTKGGLTWMAGSVGAAAIGHTLGTNIGGIKEASKLARFKTLPTRIAVVLGAVLTGATAQAILDWILPSRPTVKKVSLNDLQQEEQSKQAKASTL